MCGINGFIYKQQTSKEVLVTKINAMNNLIVHRGPDDDGVFTEENSTYGIAMGMRRLSIIDLHSGKQPITTNDGQITIVFNGEIYNYLELKKELLNQGASFKTNSDTEVILKLYELEGVKSFSKLDGMFAFSIYDKKIGKVFIARDFFGEKPLYYTNNSKEFIWASELKSILKDLAVKPKINKKGLNLFFRLTYIPAPYSIYENIHKLEANHYISYDLNDDSLEIFPIEKSKKHIIDNSITLTKAKNDVKELMYNSVQSRAISDVPLGTFLSGGVDSSIVSLCLSQASSKPIDTFSIGFQKKSYDESDKSRVVAKMIKSNHHEFIISEKDLEENINEILLNFDEPFSDSSSLPTYLVANKTREHVTVALTGDGGDEMFGGYNKYYMGKLNQKYTSVVPKIIHKSFNKIMEPALKVSNDNRGLRFKTKRLLNSIDYKGQFYWDIISLGYTKNSLHNYLKPSSLDDDIFTYYKNKTGIDKPKSISDFRTIDKHLSLEGDMLVKVDRTSMLNSLECRAPFLNKKIWNYSHTLPEKFLMKGWDKKFILKEAFRDQFPKDFLDKSKSGFGAPVGDWLKSTLRPELESYILEKDLIDQDIFNISKIRELVYNHLTGKEDNTFKVWTFYCFQKWYYNIYLNKIL